jgi:glutamyl/glutaminyl-tRNA synthetase
MLRTRIAPTPSGLLHLGNAWSFVLTWLAARSAPTASGRGRIHLRIDDLDAARTQDAFLEDIFASLRWLGIDWDGGPRDVAEFKAAHSQRLRLDRYRAAVEKLKVHEMVYACDCSRAQIRLSGPVYPGTCRLRSLDFEQPDHSVRFAVPSGVVALRDADGGAFVLHPARDPGDFVVVRRDGDPAYHLASVIDDTDLGVNFVVRGLDLRPSTCATDFPTPHRFSAGSHARWARTLRESTRYVTSSGGSTRFESRPTPCTFPIFGVSSKPKFQIDKSDTGHGSVVLH